MRLERSNGIRHSALQLSDLSHVTCARFHFWSEVALLVLLSQVATNSSCLVELKPHAKDLCHLVTVVRNAMYDAL